MKKVELLKLLPAWKPDDAAYSIVAYDMLNRFCNELLANIIQGKSLTFNSTARDLRCIDPNRLVVHRINEVEYTVSQYVAYYGSKRLIARVGVSVLNDKRKAYPSYMESKNQHHATLISWEDGNMLIAFTDWLRMLNRYQYCMSPTMLNGALKRFRPIIL